MPEPSLYFPDDIPYVMFESGLTFVDVVTQSPSKRRQQVRNISGDLPLSKFNIRVGAIAGDSTTGVTTSTTTWMEFYEFMLTIKGRYRRFYIFDPKVRDWHDDFIRYSTITNGSPPPDMLVDLPIVLPYKGGSGPVIDGTSPLTGVTYDQGGPGGEWRIITADTPALIEATFNERFDFPGSHKRFAVRSAVSEFPFTFDFSAADPYTEVTFQVIESDSDPVGLA